MGLDKVNFPPRRFEETEVNEASYFLKELADELGIVSVANTLRTVLASRKKQNQLMKLARKLVKEEELGQNEVQSNN